MKQGQLLIADHLWLAQVEYARRLSARMRGLLGRAALGRGRGLLIEQCRAVHTVGMRFELDLVFIDRAWQVVKIIKGVPRGRLMIFGGLRAYRVLECEANCVDFTPLQIGIKLEWRDGA